MIKQFLLTYGFRRISACKKLGWKTIPCIIKGEDNIKKIPIEEIIIPEGNTRIKQTGEAMEQLMISIKQYGLLEPIGVVNSKNVEEQDFLILNIVENLHREDISPFELSNGLRRLVKLGLNKGEIAARLSLPKTRVESLIKMTNVFKEEHLKEISFIPMGHGSNKKGRLSYTVAKEIGSARLSDKDREELLNFAKKEELSRDDIKIIIDLILNGMNLEESIKNRYKYKRVHATIIADTLAWKESNLDMKKASQVINLILQGKILMNPKLFYFKQKIKK